jgi:hypothetical protein
MLVQLPDGSWVDPKLIVHVGLHAASTGIGGRLPDRVVVVAGNGLILINCESYEDAETLRDRIAGAANGEEWQS